MRGHLEERGKNVWRAKVYLGADSTGSQRYLTRTVRGPKKIAHEVLRDLIAEAGRGGVVTDGTMADLAAKWRAQAEPNLSPTTLREYRRLLDRHILPRFGKTKVRNLKAADLDAFYAELQRRGGNRSKAPLGAQSIHHIHALLRHLLNEAVRWGWITTSPAVRASPPRVHKHQMRIPTATEIAQIIATADEQDQSLGTFLRISVVTGARRGEVCALRWTDIDDRHKTLSISRSLMGQRSGQLQEKSTKTHASRRIALHEDTLGVLERHRARCEARAQAAEGKLPDDAFVFSDDPEGQEPWRPNRVTLAFSRLCRGAGVRNVRLHDLRHFAATQMLSAGVPVHIVAGRLGHANAATTLGVYAHFLESSDETAAGVLAGLMPPEPDA